MVCGYPWNPDRQDEKLEAFRQAFRERFGEEPETYAAHAYDGMNMLIWAIQTAGLNRAKIRDVIAYRSEPFPGVTGDIPLECDARRRRRGLPGAPGERQMEVQVARRPRHPAISASVARHAADRRRCRYAAACRTGTDCGRAGAVLRLRDATRQRTSVRRASQPTADAAVRNPHRILRAVRSAASAVRQPLARGAASDRRRQPAGRISRQAVSLLPAWSDNPWGSGVKQITQLVYRDRVWAIVGGVDGPTTHLAEQVVVKARLALVSPVSTDKTVNFTNVPWMFSLAPNDHLVADVLTEEIARRARGHRLVLVTTNDHDAFLLTRELRRAMTARQIAPDYQFEYQPQSRELTHLVHECLAARPDESDRHRQCHGLAAVGARPCVRPGSRAVFSADPRWAASSFVRQMAETAGELVFRA